MVILAVTIIILALVAIWQSSRLLKKEGLPEGKLVYSDTHLWQSVVTPLFDQELGLTGKPDYIIKKGHEIIPVEIKSGGGNSTPRDSHIYQLAAYCYLIQKTFEQRPAYGIIHYTCGNEKSIKNNSQTYTINYTKQLETTLLTAINQIRSSENHREIPRSHHSPSRCKRCGYRTNCDQRL